MTTKHEKKKKHDTICYPAALFSVGGHFWRGLKILPNQQERHGNWKRIYLNKSIYI